MYLWNRVWGRHVVNHKVPYGTPPPREHSNVYLRMYTYPPTPFSFFHCFKQRMPLKCYVCHFSQAIEAKNVAFPTNYGYPSLGTIHRNARRVQVTASAVLLHLVFLKTRQMEMACLITFTASITLSLKMYVWGGRDYVSSIHFTVARFYWWGMIAYIFEEVFFL